MDDVRKDTKALDVDKIDGSGDRLLVQRMVSKACNRWTNLDFK